MLMYKITFYLLLNNKQTINRQTRLHNKRQLVAICAIVNMECKHKFHFISIIFRSVRFNLFPVTSNGQNTLMKMSNVV